jgi:hypothetical protein
MTVNNLSLDDNIDVTKAHIREAPRALLDQWAELASRGGSYTSFSALIVSEQRRRDRQRELTFWAIAMVVGVVGLILTAMAL